MGDMSKRRILIFEKKRLEDMLEEIGILDKTENIESDGAKITVTFKEGETLPVPAREFNKKDFGQWKLKKIKKADARIIKPAPRKGKK